MKNIKILKIVLISLMIISGLLITIDKASDIKKKSNDTKKMEEYFKLDKKKTKDKYIGILEIPKINLKRGFYDLNDSKNIIDKNITLLKINKNIIVFAAHSGNAYIAYFNDIKKLQKKDIIIVDYKHKKEIYEVYSKGLDDKDGKIKITKEKNKRLVLVTCNNNDKNNYLIIKAQKKEYSNE